MQDSKSDAQAYAWNWFALHAGQRLQLVNFWLVSVAFLVAAFVQAYSNHMAAIAVGVSVAGFVSSIAFMRLDVRTRQLVHVAEAALRYFETKRANEGFDEVAELVRAADQCRRSRLDSYRFIIQGLQLSVAALFAVATVYCLVSI